MPHIFIALFIAAFIAIAVYAWRREKKRAEAFTALAEHLGLRYRGKMSAYEIAGQYAPLELLTRGNANRVGKHVLVGKFEGFEVMTCAYQYTRRSGSGKNRSSTTYHRGLAMLKLNLHTPRLLIRKEGMFDKVGGWFGLDDIDFESDQFSRQYWVKCDNPKFAYMLIDPRMMELLLARSAYQWELSNGWIAVWREDELDPEETPDLLKSLAAFAGAVPRIVKEQYRAG